MIYDAIVLGGGAAGLFAAITAGKRGKRVLVVERNHKVGRKIAISGGGRCNFTNLNVAAENFVSANPHFCRSALARFTPNDFISLVDRHRIDFYEKKAGQLFCRGSSQQIIDMLLAECREAGVKIETGVSISEVVRQDRFEIRSANRSFYGRTLIVATGGLSFPKVGATDLGYRLARQFGHSVTDLRPSLVALERAGDRHSSGLAGVSAKAVVSTDAASFRDEILFTHKGLSGPAILQISNYWRKGVPVSIDLLPDIARDEFERMIRESGKNVENTLATILPSKLAAQIAVPIGALRGSQAGRDQIERLLIELKHHSVQFGRTAGYDRAEVTLGGVATDDISSRSMESKLCPGLFFVGEVVDVTGWLGGYNFQWAWASGAAAAEAL